MRLPPGTKVYSAHLNGTQGGHDKTTVWHLMMGYIQIIVSFESFIASHPSQRPPLRPKSWCFTFAHGERWEILEPPIHPREDPQSNFRRLNLKSRLHPSRLHIWLSRCLQDGLLYCLNSCVASNAANLCHHADLLLSVHATAGEYPSEMNAGAFWFFFVLPQYKVCFLPFTIKLPCRRIKRKPLPSIRHRLEWKQPPVFSFFEGKSYWVFQNLD